MLKDMKLSTDVTMMIEMYKLHNTELEDVNVIRKEELDYTDASIPYHESNRISCLDNWILGECTNVNYAVDDSKELNKIINHNFTIPRDRIDEFNGSEVADPDRYSASLDINVYIDDENMTCYMIDNASQSKKDDKLKVKTFTEVDYNDVDKLLKNILRLSKNNYIPTSNVVSNLRELWLHQIQNDLPDKDVELLDNHHIRDIILQVESEMKNYSNNIRVGISFEQLFDFFDEVANKKVTPKTNKVQQWITYSDTSSILNTVMSHQNYETLSDNFELADTNDYKKIRSQFYKDSEFKRKYRINNVYTFGAEKPLKPNHKRIEGVHGTPNQTIMSIMLNGLQTNDELDNNKVNHVYTGSGLGKGIYFARPHQVSKSSNYTGRSQSKKNYLICADIDYEIGTEKTTNSYDGGTDASQYSVIIANSVGISRGFDEILAPHGDNINIRYIVEIEVRH